MMESVPNISEGRRAGVVEEIAGAAERRGCRVIDVHSDPDHNRSVLTLVGDAAGLLQGLLAAAQTAFSCIDIRDHVGVHPWLGALDVVPFVPLDGSSLEECVVAARGFAERLGTELAVPVFLYAEAALRQETRRLADLRRGGPGALQERMGLGLLPPDYGPGTLHPTAGATAVGARRPLVAYNVQLATQDLPVAQAIARTVRETNGGLPGVQALGLPLAARGVVQVSMNLTDLAATDVAQAFAAVAQAARAHSVEVLDSEFVGLVPRSAVEGITGSDIRLRGNLEAAVLENRIERQ